jgi:lysophospholipase L1-like esterase
MSPPLAGLSRCLRSLLFALGLLPAVLFATEIHLSPTGNDAHPGTVALPVATPQRAQGLVRSLIQSGLTESVEVIFLTGTYVMTAPLELRPQDSGTAAFPITWKAAAGAEVILSGGRQITSQWTAVSGGVWQTDLTGIGLGTTQWNFRQLFVDGSRATRARFPNATEANPFLYATGGDFAYLTIAPALTKSSWGAAADAQINVVPQSRFFNQWNTVTAVNTSTGRIDIADSERHRLINSGSWFWIEGVQEELDQPGEWFLHPTTGRLSYIPPVGVDPNTQHIVAPFLNRLINAKGDVAAGTYVAHVHVDGLKFRHTSFTLGHIEARVHTDTAIMFENTVDSSVKNCHFENIGGYALWLHLDSQRNRFDHNTVQYSGGGGVLATGSRFAYMDDSKIYTPGPEAAKVAPILNEITHNTVEHCGRIRYYGGGVHLDSRPFSMTMAPGNYIAHNHFNDLSRNGVFAFRNQGGNVIEYNHIHNALQTTIDGGCIHFATMNTLNAPNFILNNWLYDAWGYNQLASGTPERKLANGVFLDWDTSNTTVKDNWIYNSVGGPVKVIFGGNRNVVQAGNQSSNTVITPPFVAEVGPGGTASKGIDLAANKLTGSIISYQDTPYFSQMGTWTQETAVGLVNLFEFKFLTATAAVPSQATFTLPITEDGNYQISLIYYRGTNRASNVPVAIDHADGIANLTWNMQQGSTYGFAVPIGSYRFAASETNTVKLSTAGTNGKVIADAVAYVKIEESTAGQSRFVSLISQGQPQTVVLYGTSLTATGAWVPQLQSAIQAAYPGMVTWVNSGGSGKASDWGVTNLQSKVIDQNPDTVFIEFSMNDAATTLAISRAQALANLTTMVDAIKLAHPACEIILQIMNPVDRRDTDTFSPRPELHLYQQDYRDFATTRGLLCIDHMPAFTALLDEGSPAYRASVPDGVHPSSEGFARYLSPVLNQAIGLPPQGLDAPLIVIDNADPAPAVVFNGTWTASSATQGYVGIDYRHNGNTAQGTSSAVFTPVIPSAGTYPLFLRWTGGTNRASNVPVTINYLGGSQTLTVDQTINGGSWFALGSFPLAAGSSTTVSLGTTATNGFVIVDALGVGMNPQVSTLRLRMDNARAAEPTTPSGTGRPSSITVWRSGSTLTPLTVPLNISGGTAMSGSDYGVLPASLTIPAGKSSASVDMLPLHDLITEGDETFKVELGPVAGYTTEYPRRASIVIENRGGNTNSPPVASAVAISGSAAVGQVLPGNYTYTDADGDMESGTTFRWLRSTDATLDAGDTLVSTAINYTVLPADVGKRLFFEVTPIAATGTPTGTAVASTSVLVSAPPPPGRLTLIEENFTGSGALHGTTADTVDASIVTAGGSATWVTGSGFQQNGAVSSGNISASLNLGSFINSAKNTANGKFELTMAISEVAGTWISLGFGAENAPSPTRNFTNTGSGTTTTTGLATIIYRAQSGIVSPSANGELDMFGGTTNTNAVDGPDGSTGTRTLTVTLDLTPAGGFNNTTHFGKVTWSDALLGTLGSHTYTTNRNFGSVLITTVAGSSGTISRLALRQVMASTYFASWLTAHAPATGFATDSDQDGLSNGIEHVFGTNPNTFTSGLSVTSATPTSLTFRHRLNPSIATDVAYSYQWSTDLVTWSAPGSVTASAPDAAQMVNVTISVPASPATRLFGRLTATLAP